MKKVHSTLVAVSISLAMALTLSCSGDGGGGDGGDSSSSSGNSLLLNFTSNYNLGELRWMPTNINSLNAGKIPFNQDSKVFAHNGKIFLLERPLITSVNPMRSDGILNCLKVTAGEPALWRADTLALGSNPYDIAFIGNTGYIAQYGINSVRIFDADSCKLGGTIPLPSTIPVQYSSSSASATTNAVSIETDGANLYVVMQTWIDYPTEAANGVLVRINATTKQITDTIPLTYYNPQSSILKNGKIYIASAYALALDSTPVTLPKSGVEWVALSGSNHDTLVSGTRLNGGVTSMALDSAGQLYMAVYRAWGNVPLYSVPIGDGNDTLSVSPTNIKEVTCLVYDDATEKLFIGNGTPGSTTVTTPSLMVYNTSNGGGSATPVLNSDYPTNAYPPYSLAIVRY
jgi:hypothetical protein